MPSTAIPPQKQMTCMLGHPVAENPIDRMFDGVYVRHGLPWQFWKCDVVSAEWLPAAIAGVRALGFAGACITVPYKVASTRWTTTSEPSARPIHATHLGAAPEHAPVPVSWGSVSAETTVVDVITNPRVTPFLRTARERGCRIVDGVEMLVQLAMQIFERWTGIRPAEDVFQRAVAHALGE